MKSIALIMLALLPTAISAKTLVIGDSLAYTLTKSAQKITPTDGYYLVGSGLIAGELDWPGFIRGLDIGPFDKIVISIGANDGVTSQQVNSYEKKASDLIAIIKNKNESIPIIWVLPPAMKNENTEQGLINTRRAITQASESSGIGVFNPGTVIGDRFTMKVNNIQIRTQDGIHYTAKGGDMLIQKIL